MKHKLLSILLCLAMALSLLPTAALADEAGTIKVGETTYSSFSDAVDAATPDESGVITYEISGKVNVSVTTSNAWGMFSLLKDDSASNKSVKTIKLVKGSENAEICIEDDKTIIGLSNASVDVVYDGLKLSRTAGKFSADAAHGTCYFTTWLRAGGKLTYTNCTFPNGTYNNQYGTTEYTQCKFSNQNESTAKIAGVGDYNLWTSSDGEGGNGVVKVSNCTFEGVRGVKLYSTNGTAGSLKLSETTFTDLTEKAAIVVSTPATVEMNAVTATGCSNGLLQKKLDNQPAGVAEIVIPSGSNVSGAFDLKAEDNVASTEFNITAGTFTGEIDTGYLAPGANYDPDTGKVKMSYVAKIGNTEYPTLAAAVAAANDDDTITLLKDCSSERVDLEDKCITIDLNGNTLTSTSAYGVMFCAKNGHKITVNGTKEGSKLVGTLMVTSGTEGHIEINGGTYENDKYCPIYINGAVSTESSTLTVKNATIKAIGGDPDQDTGCGIYLAGYSTSTFENTTVTAPVTGIEIRAGKLTLTNCDVTGGSGEVETNANGNGTTVKNAALAISQHNTKKPIDVTINGGTFTGTAAVYQTDVQGTGSTDVKASVKNGNFNGTVSAATNGTIEVSGGTFTSAVPENCCAPGFVPKDNGDGTYGVKIADNMAAEVLDAQGNTVGAYGTLADAVANASDGQTVTLLKNVEITEQLNIDKAITLDGGGHTITRKPGGSKPAVKAGILVKAGATIQNLTVSGPNTNAGSWDSGEFGIKFFNADGAKLIDSKVTGANAGVQVNGGSVTMNGTIDLSDNEFGGIEVCNSGNLDISMAALESNNEAYTCPILWNDDTKGTITQNAAQPLSVRAIGNNNDKDHYYIDANKTILSQLTTDIGEKRFVVGVPTEFTFTTTANGDAGKLVVGTSNFSNTAAIEKLEYYEEQDGKWYTLSGNFGPANGFPMADATSKFRVTFKTAGTYSFEASMKLAGTETVLCSTSVSFTVSNPSSSSGGSSTPTYPISTPSKTENGTVTVSPKNASKGDTVTITVKPDSGYVLDDLTVTDKNGNELKLTDKGNGKYTFTMPAGKVEVKASFAKEVETSPFADVATDDYYYEAVKWAVKNGITTGVGGNLFAPGQPCTRAQIVTFLWRAAGSPEPKGTAAGMTDVVSGSYYEKAVAWAIENGVTTGTTASTFSPDATCTRAQAVTFLARALNAKAAGKAEFSDVPADSYFADAVAWAAANGVTEGVGSGLFAPDNDCTRGQIVTFLYRAYNK